MEDSVDEAKVIMKKKIDKYQGFSQFAKDIKKSEKSSNGNKFFSFFKSKAVVTQPQNNSTFAQQIQIYQ